MTDLNVFLSSLLSGDGSCRVFAIGMSGHFLQTSPHITNLVLASLDNIYCEEILMLTILI